MQRKWVVRRIRNKKNIYTLILNGKEENKQMLLENSCNKFVDTYIIYSNTDTEKTMGNKKQKAIKNILMKQEHS